VAKPLVAELSTKIVLQELQGLQVLFYRAALPLSHQTLTFVSGLIRAHRREIGSPWRALNPGQQALLVLVYLRKGEPFAQVGAGFGVSTTTCWRYVTETVELLAARAPKLREALRAAKRRKMAYVIIDGTLIPIDRIAADRPFYSGKHKRHGVNLQVIASPDGEILWVSGQLPGKTHDTAAARIWNILAALEESWADRVGRQGLPRLRPNPTARDHPLQRQEQTRIAERRQSCPRTPPRTR